MSLIAFGINHHTTPITIREKLALNETQLPDALQDLVKHDAIDEAVILSTCNRTEIYANTKDASALQQCLIKHKSIAIDLSPYAYTYADIDAVRHIMRVASGLNSMVVGEPQILGQMKQAYFAAQNAGATGVFLNQLFPAIFTASKVIRTNTAIGAHPVSIAYAITQLSKKYYGTLSDRTILLIGAGETIQLAATHLHGVGAKKIIIANRTLEKSNVIAHTINAQTICMQDIPDQLKNCDIVISATASQLPIIGKGLIESTLKNNNGRSLLLVDLAIPRDIEPEVAKLARAHLFHLDDLQSIITENLKGREAASKQAEIMIDVEADQFYEKMRVFRARRVIAQYRDRLDSIRLEEQNKALQQLQNGHDPQRVLEQFGHTLINKIMHHPTIKLREAASEEKCEIFQHIKTFFELT